MTKLQRNRAKMIGKFRSNKEEMLAAGYSESTAIKQPPAVMKAKGWQELLERKLPDDDLLKVTRDGLVADKIILSPTEPDREYPDYAIRLKAAEQGYKLKGRFVEQPGGNTTNILVIPSELMEKYGITPNTKDSS